MGSRHKLNFLWDRRPVGFLLCFPLLWRSRSCFLDKVWEGILNGVYVSMQMPEYFREPGFHVCCSRAMLVSIWWYVCFRVVLVSIWLHVSVSVYCWIAFGGTRFSRALLVNTWLQLMLSCCVLYYLAHSQNCTFRRMRTSESVDFVSVLVEIKSCKHCSCVSMVC